MDAISDVCRTEELQQNSSTWDIKYIKLSQIQHRDLTPKMQCNTYNTTTNERNEGNGTKKVFSDNQSSSS